MENEKLTNHNIVDEMSNSFLDYAMSVIVSRALPDVRDGLKPVHRRILYAMNDLGNTADKPYKKSARIVGDVIGKYHPHGDTSVYDAMVRMSQDFSFRVPLVDGHGNFGSIDGDGAAAMRYTEARMSRVAMELLKDINKNTIDFQDNYDGSEREPIVLPSRIPNLLVNGTSGIAVGMATSIAPHNLEEVVNATIAYMKNRDITIPELMEYIKGPDFPLGAQVLGDHGIRKAYETGNGSIRVRSKYEIVYDKRDRASIVVTEIPFQVNKASMVEKIAQTVKDKRVEGIVDLRDESDRDGIRVVMDLSRGTTPEVVINNLFKHTQLESSFSFNMLALVHGEPKVLNLKEMIHHYVEHQIEVTRRKTQFELSKAQDRAHILEGLSIALDSIDRVIAIIRGAKTQEDAMTSLSSEFGLSERQAKSILEMQLRRLTGLEREKIENELNELKALILDLTEILGSEERINTIIIDELTEITMKYGSPRRTEILAGNFESDLDFESLIEEENVIITLTEAGYIKRLAADTYKTQGRGGKGLKGMNVNNEDQVSEMLFTSTHSDVLFFTNTGKVFRTRAHRIPAYSRTAKGLPLVNLIDIEKDEVITNLISIDEYNENEYLMIVTENGLGKKTSLTEYSRINKNGKKAVVLNEGDLVNTVKVIKENEELIIASRGGKALHANESAFRAQGRTSRGVRALRLAEGDKIVGAEIVNPEDLVVTISEFGFGKATPIEEYRLQNRGGKGIKNLNITAKNGQVVKIKKIAPSDLATTDLLIITEAGQVIRLSGADMKISGRSTQGVTLMRMSEDDCIANVELIEADSIEEAEDVSRETLEVESSQVENNEE